VVVKHVPDPIRDLDRAIARDLRHLPNGLDDEVSEEDRLANIKRAVRRAKKEVRLKCKAMGVNSLWTLTYRANVVDRERALAHLDAFRRRVVAVLGDWKYIAVAEKQERGAYHWHLATHALPVRIVQGGVKVKSWDVMRAIWRSVTGDLGGNFDEAKRSSRWSKHAKPIRGAANIASYIAGYVAKDMIDSPAGRKRFSSSKGVDLPKPNRLIFVGDTGFLELIERAYAAVGERITGTWFNDARGVFTVASDDTPEGRWAGS